ncbi:YqcC family protein [Pseudohaliea rubra]|uniref:YqcC-like domain-containing protein n=1 Tax=Pseudohaliea rubra DSM 19751 TaxID=1265313 RepID=A0A095VM56_9GAMM|nr:YqcC family protein [Pseudohaliea rubra]KGE02547.1 hypothetical protein HRUBRA_02812 [Pseudohaliea rubra DSM 19751]
MHTQVAEILIDIEAELRQLQLWEREPPPADALASTQPFCFDTLTLPQWLQFVFLPRMQELVAAEAQLPGDCGIRPMAEEHFRNAQLPIRELLLALDRIDRLLGGA